MTHDLVIDADGRAIRRPAWAEGMSDDYLSAIVPPNVWARACPGGVAVYPPEAVSPTWLWHGLGPRLRRELVRADRPVRPAAVRDPQPAASQPDGWTMFECADGRRIPLPTSVADRIGICRGCEQYVSDRRLGWCRAMPCSSCYTARLAAGQFPSREFNACRHVAGGGSSDDRTSFEGRDLDPLLGSAKM